MHDLLKQVHPTGPATAPLAKDIHRNRRQTDEHMDAPNDAKHFLGALRRDPRGDKIIHAERVDVAQVDGGKGFGRLVAMAVGQVAVDGDGHESDAEVLQSVEDDGTNPGIPDLQRDPEAEERHAAQHEGDDDDDQTKLRLVDAVVVATHRLRSPVGRGTRDEGPDDGADQRRDGHQSNPGDGEVVRRCGEELGENAPDHDQPGGRQPVGKEAEDNLREREHHQRPDEDLPEGIVTGTAVEDLQIMPVGVLLLQPGGGGIALGALDVVDGRFFKTVRLVGDKLYRAIMGA